MYDFYTMYWIATATGCSHARFCETARQQFEIWNVGFDFGGAHAVARYLCGA